MMVIGIILGVILALFVGAFFSKRRFGVLGLGLAAGAIISPIWSDNAGFVISSTGLVSECPLVNAIAVSLLILVPAVLFMFHGYSYAHIVGRVFGSLLFTVLAAAFLIEPISAVIVLTGPIGMVYQWLVTNHELIISIGVAFAVADFLVSKSSHKSDKKRR
ncbi:hypothetical protein H7100_01720 [Candidatus Saccharibacteria bacterium]|nr:hypothetical protein [Candidatus Saccharibacteria bacterium]